MQAYVGNIDNSRREILLSRAKIYEYAERACSEFAGGSWGLGLGMMR